ncbi:unnamed protein product [Eruca vesicaria subsp. sativa]|uniref:Uncharacterized protein n=1 Tax=Eruca vesicaria subsp. sativa TaxID=29727 RepID=A0ABC8K6A1_ERUVS|nr:unnamed protein product [Eruca vesicaria subsp. sativa]
MGIHSTFKVLGMEEQIKLISLNLKATKDDDISKIHHEFEQAKQIPKMNSQDFAYFLRSI